MTRDVPPVFSGIVEVDETYLGGHINTPSRASGGYWKRKLAAKGGTCRERLPLYVLPCFLRDMRCQKIDFTLG